MAAFQSEVVDHNGKQLAALAVSEGSTWFNVLSEQAFADARRKIPDCSHHLLFQPRP